MAAETQHAEQTTYRAEDTFGLGEIVLRHPPGTFVPTTSSRLALEAIGRFPDLFRGNGIDWGCGVGPLTIAAARVFNVERVIGLDNNAASIVAAKENAAANAVSSKTRFLYADSFSPFDEADRSTLEEFRGKASFVLAYPPTSAGDDGFEWRRSVMRSAREFLAPRGVLVLNASYQYGPERLDQLTAEMPEYRAAGVLASSDLFPFDLKKPEMLQTLVQYAHIESSGGMRYTFPNPKELTGDPVTATQALERFESRGEIPYTMWMYLLFRFRY